jgi:hypothetical protein
MANYVEIIQDCEEVEIVSCNKDTVGKTRLQKCSGTLMPGSKIVNSRKYIKICKKSVKPSILTVQVL